MNYEIKKQILDKIKEYNRIIIFRHKRPDGDATGSTKGLQRILKLSFPEKEILLQNSDFANYMAFLGGEDAPIADEAYAEQQREFPIRSSASARRSSRSTTISTSLLMASLCGLRRRDPLPAR